MSIRFEPKLVLNKYDGGLNTQDFPENLENNQTFSVSNIDFKAKTVKKAAGYEEKGTDVTSGIGFFLYNQRTIADSDEALMKTVDTQIKMLDEVTNTFVPLTDATFTAGRKWWGASFNGYFYGGNGVDNFVRWKSSSWATLDGAILAGATTIDLQAGQGARFPATGDGMIEGDTFSWTGVSTDQLTGVTGLTSNHADGSRVIQELDASTYSSNPKGSVGAFFKLRLFVRDDSNPTTLYHSKLADDSSPQDDLANFTIAGGVSGDAGFFIFPAEILGVKVWITGQDQPVLLVTCSDGVVYSASVVDEGGATVQLYTAIKVIGGDLVAKDMITTTENDFILMDNKNTIRSFSYETKDNPIKSERISDIIQPTLSQFDFSDGYMDFFDRRIFIGGKANDSEVNNITMVKDTNPNAWGMYDHWQINDLAEWKNNLYGISSLDNKVFKLFTGLSANGDIIASQYYTKQFNFNYPLMLKTLRTIRISGFITNGCLLNFDIFYDESEQPFTFTISGDDTQITTPLANVAIGTVVFGTGVVGGGLPDGVVAKRFYAELSLPTMRYFYTSYVKVYNTQKDVDFELDTMLFFAQEADPGLVKKGLVQASS